MRYRCDLFEGNRGHERRIHDRINYAGSLPSCWQNRQILARGSRAYGIKFQLLPLNNSIRTQNNISTAQQNPIFAILKRNKYFTSPSMAKAGTSITAATSESRFFFLPLQTMLVTEPYYRTVSRNSSRTSIVNCRYRE